jgi:hypothetical protein
MDVKLRAFASLQQARDALCLDWGYDPFMAGEVRDERGRLVRRPTTRAVASLGYVVARPLGEGAARCPVCRTDAPVRIFRERTEPHGLIAVCQRCDWGWRAPHHGITRLPR